MSLQINVCPKFWKDVKELRKITKSKNFTMMFVEERECDDQTRIELTPYIKAVVNTILNAAEAGILNQLADKYFKQPFLKNGWTLWKMRYALDKSGQSGGTRTIFAANTDRILLILISMKNRIDDERKLEKEIIARMENYLIL